MMDTAAKPIWESKTFWWNILTGLGMLLTATEVLAVVPATWLPYLAALNAGVNIIIRVAWTKNAIG